MRHRADEEQSSLLVLGHTYKEPPRPSRADLATLGIRVREPFYHHHAERLGRQLITLMGQIKMVTCFNPVHIAFETAI